MNEPQSSRRPLSSALVLVAALAAGAGLWLGQRYYAPVAPPVMQSAVLYPKPQPLPDFALRLAQGTPLRPAEFQGRWNLVFFGFTNCPDVCPVTLAVLADVERSLQKSGLQQAIGVTFVSVDPERDSDATLARYVAFFSPTFRAATGDDAALQALTRGLGLVYLRTPDANGSYTVDHSSSILLIDPAARVAGLFRPPFDAERIAADMRSLIETD